MSVFWNVIAVIVFGTMDKKNFEDFGDILG